MNNRKYNQEKFFHSHYMYTRLDKACFIFLIFVMPFLCFYYLCTTPIKEVFIREANSCVLEQHYILSDQTQVILSCPKNVRVRHCRSGWKRSSPFFAISENINDPYIGETDKDIFQIPYIFSPFFAKKDATKINELNSNIKITKYNTIIVFFIVMNILSILGPLLLGVRPNQNKNK